MVGEQNDPVPSQLSACTPVTHCSTELPLHPVMLFRGWNSLEPFTERRGQSQRIGFPWHVSWRVDPAQRWCGPALGEWMKDAPWSMPGLLAVAVTGRRPPCQGAQPCLHKDALKEGENRLLLQAEGCWSSMGLLLLCQVGFLQKTPWQSWLLAWEGTPSP